MKGLAIGTVLVFACCGQTSKPKAYVPKNDFTKPIKECEEHSGTVARSFGEMMLVCKDGRFVVDEQATAEIKKREDHRRDLYWALRTRVLKSSEMDEVKRYGFRLTVDIGESFSEPEKIAEFNAALLQQFNIRLAVEAR